MSKRTSSSSHVPTPGSTSNDNRLYNATPNNLYGTNQIYDSNISQARHIYDESLGEDDVDGIKALLRTGDAQIDMGDFSDAFRGRDPSNVRIIAHDYQLYETVYSLSLSNDSILVSSLDDSSSQCSIDVQRR